VHDRVDVTGPRITINFDERGSVEDWSVSVCAWQTTMSWNPHNVGRKSRIARLNSCCGAGL